MSHAYILYYIFYLQSVSTFLCRQAHFELHTINLCIYNYVYNVTKELPFQGTKLVFGIIFMPELVDNLCVLCDIKVNCKAIKVDWNNEPSCI